MTTEWLLVTQIACVFPGSVKCKYAKLLDIHALKSTYVVYSPQGLVESPST